MHAKKNLTRVWDLLTGDERRQAVLVFLVMILAAAFQAVGVGSIHPFLNVVTNPSAALDVPVLGTLLQAAGWTSDRALIMATGVGVFLLVVVGNALLTFSTWMQLRFRWGVTHSLSARLLRSYVSRDYEFYLRRNTSNLTRNIVDETNKINVNIINPILRMVSQGAIALALGGVLLLVNPWVTLFVFLFVGGAYGLAYLFIRKRLRSLGEGYSSSNEARFQILQEVFGGIKSLKLADRESDLVDDFESSSEVYVRKLAAKSVLQASPKYVIEAIAFGSILIILLSLVVTGNSISSIVPLVGLFAFAGYRMMPAFREILAAASAFQFFDDLLTEIRDDLSEGTEIDEGAVDPLPVESSIHLSDVSYTYPGSSDPTLEGIDMTLGKGEMVALVGPTGAGKTTLADILLGLLEPSEGQLEVDGRPLDGTDVRRYQRQLGYVPQTIFLTDDTIRRNIAFGLPKERIDDEAVREATKIAQIHEFIETELEDGYETVVGEDGIRLSGGQRQRIGIARALYADPEILVFDEATSDVDGVTQAKITEAVHDLHGEKTLIIIAHRLSTLRDADRIHLLREGKLVNSGTYSELQQDNERFRAMAEGTVLEEA
jgi:ATP-binding cassette subfamily C protein